MSPSAAVRACPRLSAGPLRLSEFHGRAADAPLSEPAALVAGVAAPSTLAADLPLEAARPLTPQHPRLGVSGPLIEASGTRRGVGLPDASLTPEHAEEAPR